MRRRMMRGVRASMFIRMHGYLWVLEWIYFRGSNGWDDECLDNILWIYFWGDLNGINGPIHLHMAT